MVPVSDVPKEPGPGCFFIQLIRGERRVVRLWLHPEGQKRSKVLDRWPQEYQPIGCGDVLIMRHADNRNSFMGRGIEVRGGCRTINMILGDLYQSRRVNDVV